MEEDKEPVPKMLFVNEAFLQATAQGSSERKQVVIDQINAFNVQNLDNRVNTEGCKCSGSSLSGHFSEDPVQEQMKSNEKVCKPDINSCQMKSVKIEQKRNENDNFLVDNSKWNKSESSIQVTTNSTVFTDSCRMKVESDGENGFESDVCHPMKTEKMENQATSNDCHCHEIKLERDEADISFINRPDQATNPDENQVSCYQMSTDLFPSKQENLPECRVLPGHRNEEMGEHSELKNMSTFTQNGCMRISPEGRDCFQTRDGTETCLERNVFNEKDRWENQNIMNCSVKNVQKCFKRTFCGKSFIERSSLRARAYMRSYAGEKHKCCVCNKTFTYACTLTMHMRIHTGEKHYKCTVCDKTFNYRSALLIHTKFHSGEKAYECTISHKAFSRDFKLTKHMKIHIGEKTYKCTVCDQAFRERYSLTAHMKIHTGEKSHICSVCDRAFTRRTTLTIHMRTHTGEKPFQCSVCDKAFSIKSHLTTHIRIHTGEKPFKCTVCDNTFACSSYLIKHMRIHTGEKPFKCTVCDVAFSRESALTIHTRNHTGEKHYKCTVCDKAFAINSLLKVHMRQHTGEKPYTCTVCDKAFGNNSHLTTHMRQHTGEKPHTCTVCDKAFTRGSTLTTHMRTHTGERPYVCTVCDKAFTRSSTLIVHMKTHPGEKTDE